MRWWLLSPGDDGELNPFMPLIDCTESEYRDGINEMKRYLEELYAPKPETPPEWWAKLGLK